MAALGAVLPRTLLQLDIAGTACGDGGFGALAAALRGLRELHKLNVGDKPPSAGPAGWAALAAALPAMRSLTALLASGCEGLGATEGGEAAGAAAPAAAAPTAPRLALMWLYDCNLREPTKLDPLDPALPGAVTACCILRQPAYKPNTIQSITIKQTPSKKQPL